MKDKNNGVIITEFFQLTAKMYASRVQGKKDTKKIKDVKSNIVARSIMFEDYTRGLNAIEMSHRQSCIRSKLHEVYTTSETKITLNPHNDKRISHISCQIPPTRYHGDITGVNKFVYSIVYIIYVYIIYIFNKYI